MLEVLPDAEETGMGGVVLYEVRSLATAMDQAFASQERKLQLLSEQLAQVALKLGDSEDMTAISKPMLLPSIGEERSEGRSVDAEEIDFSSSFPMPKDSFVDRGNSFMRETSPVGERCGDESSPMGASMPVDAAHTAAQETLQAHFKFHALESQVSNLWTADRTMMDHWRDENKFEIIVKVYDRFMGIVEPERSGALAWLLSRGKRCFLAVIILNAVWMVWSVNHEVAEPTKDPPPEFQAVEIAFVVVYTFELLLRLAVHRLYFFVNDDMGWNLVDFFVVLYSILELLFLGEAVERLSFLRVLRLFKISKLLRLFRVIRFLQELRVMLMCLLGSIGKLFWSIAMMILTFYMFSMVFVQGVVSYRSSNSDSSSDVDDAMLSAFGSLESSLLTMYKMSTGESWVPYYEAMLPTGEFYSCLVLFFVAFSQIALLNVLTGIFVDSAMKLAEPEPEQKAQEKVLEDQKLSTVLRRLTMRELGLSTDQTRFPMRVLMNRLSGTRLGSYLHYIGVDINEIHHFINLGAEVTGDTHMDTQTFVRACMRVKGWATSLDLQHVLLELKVLHKETSAHLERIFDTVSERPKNGRAVRKQHDWHRTHLGVSSVTPDLGD